MYSYALPCMQVDLVSVAMGLVDDLMNTLQEKAEVKKSDFVAAVGSDQRFSKPVVVSSVLINKLFLSWEDELPIGARRRLFFTHYRKDGHAGTSIIAKSR